MEPKEHEKGVFTKHIEEMEATLRTMGLRNEHEGNHEDEVEVNHEDQKLGIEPKPPVRQREKALFSPVKKTFAANTRVLKARKDRQRE